MIGAIAIKRSNLVLPTSGYELDREEMSYVEGGLTLNSSGLYFSYDDILAITIFVGTNQYAVASAMSAASSWICSTGIGAVLWALFSVSSVYVAIKALSALSQKKGLLISVEFTKIWFVKIPTGLNFKVK